MRFRQRNSNGNLVLGVGLEPTSLAALAPKASAFAISPPQRHNNYIFSGGLTLLDLIQLLLFFKFLFCLLQSTRHLQTLPTEIG